VIKKFGKQEGKGWVGIRLNEQQQVIEAGSDGDM
jgi:hypothetical protein